MSQGTPPAAGTIDPTPAPARRRIPRVRVSVRAMMAVVLVLAVGLGFYVRSVHVQQDAVAAVIKAGGSVDYDWRWGNYNPDIVDNDGKWRAPKWLARIVPIDYVANVINVDLTPRRHRGAAPPPAGDEVLAHVGQFRHLTNLSLDGTAITDAGLAHLASLSHLRNLRIDRTRVGDAGLAQIQGLTGLFSLALSGSRVTDAGVLDLESALPHLWLHREEDMLPSTSMSRILTDLEFARSLPVRQACHALAYRAQVLKARPDLSAFVATVEALCDLEASDELSLARIAEARAGCLGFLDPAHTPALAEARRRALRRRCTDRAIEALTRAIGLGYDNLRRLDGDVQECRGFWNLREDTAFRELVEAMKAKRAGR